MKAYGKIVEYDGYNGTIVDNKGNKFILMSKEVVNDTLEVGDYVSFKPEVFKTVEVKENIARFVTKIDKEKESTE